MSSFSELRRKLIDARACWRGDFLGLSDRDIEKVAQAAGRKLPAAYVDYLKVMGGDALPLEGSEAFYPEILDLRTAAERLLAECGNPIVLPPHAFVFFMHQGYNFKYFLVEEGVEDPPVFHFMEGDPVAKQEGTLTSVLTRELELILRVRPR